MRMQKDRENRVKRLRGSKSLVEKDINERVALGEKVGDFTVTELKIDERLKNMPGGVNSGFKGDDVDIIYDKPLFAQKVKANIYSGVQQFNDIKGDNDEDYFDKKSVYKKKRGHNIVKRARPVQFEKFKGVKKVKEE